MSSTVAVAGKPRALLLCYLCSPEHGSEPGVGWNQAVAVADAFDVTVITLDDERYRPAIERRLAASDAPPIKFVFVPKTLRELRLTQVSWLYYVTLHRWHQRAFDIARQLHAEQPFDLVHQVNLCGYREPGLLWRLGPPFIWGPVGGTQNIPTQFFSEFGLAEALAERTRNCLNRLQLRWSSRVRRAATSAACFLAANQLVQRELEENLQVRPELLLETGVREVGAPRKWSGANRPLRIFWSGNLVARKGPTLFLKALGRLKDQLPFEAVILGRGPDEARLKRLTEQLGIAKQVSFRGFLPHAEAVQLNAWADVFVFTSLRDTSGTVVLEAMSRGLPVIVLDHQGVHDIVTEGAGVKIPLTNPTQVVSDIAAAIEHLARDSAAWERLSARGVTRARDYLWSRRAEVIQGIYRRVLAANRAAPAPM